MSPFLFNILMTVLLHGCRDQLPVVGNILQDLLDADDTLLVGTDAGLLQQFMEIIASEGKKYGLALNDEKLVLLRIKSDQDIFDSGGNTIPVKNQMQYLGAMLSDSGGHDVELNRRLAIAAQEFRSLARIWKHCNITTSRKLEVYGSHVISKLVYGLQTMWLSKRQRIKLDGFHCKHLRKILNIPHSFISRIPNKTVLDKSQMGTMIAKLLQHQMIYFGNVVRNADHPVRAAIFTDGTMDLQTIHRRVGRPRLNWSEEIMKHVMKANDLYASVILSKTEWRNTVIKYCKNVIVY